MSARIRQARRRERVTIAVGVVAITLAGGWATWPVKPAPVELPELITDQADSNAQPAASALDLASFDAPIWNPRPKPTTPATQPEPASVPRQPLRLQLIAIVWEGEEPAAALYDPDADRLLLARSGATVAHHTVTLVDRRGVELRPAAGAAQRLDLIAPEAAP